MHTSIIIFVIFILYALFIFCFSLIYTISFISLLNLRFEDTYSTFILIVARAINNKLRVIFVYIFVLCVRFLSLFVFYNLLIVFFNLFNTTIILIYLFSIRNALSRHVIFSIRVYYLLKVAIEISNISFFFDLF